MYENFGMRLTSHNIKIKRTLLKKKHYPLTSLIKTQNCDFCTIKRNFIPASN